MPVNEEIDLAEARIIGPNGEVLGIMSSDKALKLAYDQGLDLVLMAPNATPPVCRIIDYGKFRFEKEKKEKEAKKKQQVIEQKEIQLSYKIAAHDFETKASHARRFLQDGNKVRVVLRFSGREITHVAMGQETVKKFGEACAEFGAVDKAPVLDGRSIIMILSPIKK